MSRINAFNWFPADLQILLLCSLNLVFINMNSEKLHWRSRTDFFVSYFYFLYLCCQIYLNLEELPEIYQDLQSLLLFHM